MNNEELKSITKDLKVLYAEDDPVVQNQMAGLFEVFFKEVKVANNGEEALEFYKKEPFDIVFTDVAMPKMNGIELSKKIREINPSQKIIIITAFNNINVLQEAINLPVDGFLSKPIDMQNFLNMIQKIVTIVHNEKLQQQFNEILKQELEEKVKEIEKKTFYDDLTGLKNRAFLMRRIKDYNGIIILININNFDSINIVYGYETGDKVLKHIASYLLTLSKNVYYLGNDEFAILDTIDINEIKIPEFKVIDDIHNIPLDFTAGIAKGENLLKKAYLALKEAKKDKKRCVVYSEDLEIEKFHKKVQEFMPIVKEALKEDLFVPFFQGIMDNKTKEITKYETLARIKYKDRIIPPFFFIDIAEKGGLIHQITKIIIDKAFNTFKDTNFEFSINLTEIDLGSDDIIEYLINKAKEYNIPKNRIILEVLEGVGQIANSIILDKLILLKKLGFKIAIDDFGTMNSNFERVALMNVDFLKIDGKFIKNIDTDKKSYAISKAITDFAKSIDAKVVAEFVHSKEVQKVVEELGIDYSQGYLFSEPSENLG